LRFRRLSVHDAAISTAAPALPGPGRPAFPTKEMGMGRVPVSLRAFARPAFRSC
jgi:hypothetical protein